MELISYAIITNFFSPASILGELLHHNQVIFEEEITDG